MNKDILKKIRNLFEIGKIIKFTPIKGGLMNHNYKVTTPHGHFVVRFIGNSMTEDYVRKKEIEQKVLQLLDKKNFPYSTPLPLKSFNGKNIEKVDGKNVSVYKWIDGNMVKNPNLNQVKSIAKALAIYHRIVGRMSGKNKTKISRLEWVEKEYEKMRNVKDASRLGKAMKANFDYFYKVFKIVQNFNFVGKILPAHSDFHQYNLLFNKNQVVGILDFDNIDWSLRAKDIANCVKSVCRKNYKFDEDKFKHFITEYKKYNKLTKAEESEIKMLIVRNYCIVFSWIYGGKMKKEVNRINLMKWNTESLKDIVNYIPNLKIEVSK